ELGIAQIAKPHRLQAGPPEPVTRGGRFDRDERVILKGSEQTPRSRRFPLHVSRTLPPNDRTYPPLNIRLVHKQLWPLGEELYAVELRRDGEESANVGEPKNRG